jgi:hypothetical protein
VTEPQCHTVELSGSAETAAVPERWSHGNIGSTDGTVGDSCVPTHNPEVDPFGDTRMLAPRCATGPAFQTGAYMIIVSESSAEATQPVGLEYGILGLTRTFAVPGSIMLRSDTRW